MYPWKLCKLYIPIYKSKNQYPSEYFTLKWLNKLNELYCVNPGVTLFVDHVLIIIMRHFISQWIKSSAELFGDDYVSTYIAPPSKTGVPIREQVDNRSPWFPKFWIVRVRDRNWLFCYFLLTISTFQHAQSGNIRKSAPKISNKYIPCIGVEMMTEKIMIACEIITIASLKLPPI